MSKYKQIMAFIESLKIDEGERMGENFSPFPWQKKLTRMLVKHDTDIALSLARGQGKSSFIAALAMCATIDCLAYPNAEVVVVAASHKQGQIVFNHAINYAEPWIQADKKRYKIRNSQNMVDFTDKETKCRLRVVAAKPRTMSGLAPLWAVCDEVSSWEPNQIDETLAILGTAMGKIPGSRAIYLSTRADTSDHQFERILNDPLIPSIVYSAEKDDKPHLKSTWLKANPSLKYMPHLEKRIRQESERAKTNPSVMASFKALRLNMGVSPTVESVLVTADTWESLEVDSIAPRGRYVLGVDMGGSSAMSAASAYWPATHELDGFAMFAFYPDLKQRGVNDGVGALYETAAERGELTQGGERVADPKQLLIKARDRFGGYPSHIVCDTYRIEELKQALIEVNFPVIPLISRRQGFGDGSEDCRAFMMACEDEQIKVKRSLLFRSAVAGARIVRDVNANPKLSKLREGGRRQNHRDDIVASSILAVSHGKRLEKRKAPEFTYAIV